MILPTHHIFPQFRNSVKPDYIFFPREMDGMIVFDDDRFGLVNEELVFGADTFVRKHAPCFPCAMAIFARDEISDPSWKTSQWARFSCLTEEGWTRYIAEEDGAFMNFCPNFKLYYPETPKFLQFVFTKMGFPMGE
jgi:hypothetical protein